MNCCLEDKVVGASSNVCGRRIHSDTAGRMVCNLKLWLIFSKYKCCLLLLETKKILLFDCQQVP